MSPLSIQFALDGNSWVLLFFRAKDRHWDVAVEVASAVRLDDPAPRGEMRQWYTHGWGQRGPNWLGEWPELDAAARGAFESAQRVAS